MTKVSIGKPPVSPMPKAFKPLTYHPTKSLPRSPFLFNSRRTAGLPRIPGTAEKVGVKPPKSTAIMQPRTGRLRSPRIRRNPETLGQMYL